MKKKTFLTILVFTAAVSAAGILKVKLADAALLPISGWLWGGSENPKDDIRNGNESGVGWISASSDNPDEGSGQTYAVNIPDSNGAVTGYAWSSNLQSYIDFAPHEGCNGSPKYAGACDAYPSNGGQQTDVMRVGSNLKGWARIIGIAKSKAAGNSGGEDGWISMDPGVGGYGVSIKANGMIEGQAWAGGVLGGLNFQTTQVKLNPIVTLEAIPDVVYLKAGETRAANAKIKLKWTITSSAAVTCDSFCTNDSGTPITCGDWENVNPTTSSVKNIVSVPQTPMKFALTCTDTNGLVGSAIPERVTVGCAVNTCQGTGNQSCTFNPSTFLQTEDFDTTPACKGGCTSDADCKLREGSNWIEVSP